MDERATLCDICYMEYEGSNNFVILPACLHYFCKSCLKLYCTDVIMRGDISRLFCPSFDGCKTFINEGQLKQAKVDQNVIDKLHAYSISQAIESMKDYSWCPKPECAEPAELDLAKNFGTCTGCSFMFCLGCKEKYHFFK